MKTSLIAAAFLLTVVPAAHARGPVLPPLGSSACAADACMVLEAGDQPTAIQQRTSNTSGPYDVANALLRQDGTYHYDSSRCTIVNLPLRPAVTSPGACYVVPGTIVTWEGRRTHQYRKLAPYMTGTFTRFYSEEGDHLWEVADSLIYRPELNSPDCNPTGENERWITLLVGSFGATPEAPEDFRVACGFERAPTPGTTPPAATTPVSTQPTLAVATCSAIVIPKRRVQVRSQNVRCTAARTIMARYLRRGIEPRGWVCVQARAGRMRTAACGRPSTSRAKAVRVTGRWRA